MYSSLLWMLFSILLVFLVLIFYIRNKEINISASKKYRNIFLTKEEIIKLITKKAGLTLEEKEKLDTLLSLSGSTKLHIGLDDEETAKTWLKTIQRILFHSKNIEQNVKEDLEFTAYEIFRKIHVARTLMYPSIRSIKDISIGQIFDIKVSNGEEIQGELISTDLHSLQVLVNKKFFPLLEKTKKNNKKITLSFWKKMDAGYIFSANILILSIQNEACIISLSQPPSIKRNKMRKHPRRECTIPCRFKIGHHEMDQDLGVFREKFGNTVLGLINNLGAKGCNIISNRPLAQDTILAIEFPLFQQTVYLKGIVKNTLSHDSLYILNIEFSDDMSREILLKIYHFIFSDLNMLQY